MIDSLNNKGFIYPSSINKNRNLRQISSANYGSDSLNGQSPGYQIGSMINKIEIMVDEYQRVRNVESRSSHRPKPQTNFSVLNKSPSHFSIIEQLSRKVRAESRKPINTSYLASSRFKQTGESSDKVGPGSYRIGRVGTSSPSYRFTSAPRLENSFDHKLAGEI
jgi:hypothetical protein